MPSAGTIMLIVGCLGICILSLAVLYGLISSNEKRTGVVCLILVVLTSAGLTYEISLSYCQSQNKGKCLPFSQLDDGYYSIVNDPIFHGILVENGTGLIRWIGLIPSGGDYRNLPDGTMVKKNGSHLEIIRTK